MFLCYFYRATVCNATHGIAKAFLSVCLPVCPSVCRTRALWQNERNFCPQSYTLWKNVYPSFPTWRMFVGVDPFYLKFWIKTDPISKNADFQSMFARSASSVIPGEKSSINTNRKSTTSFPMSLWDEQSMLSLSPQWGLKKGKVAGFYLKFEQ